MLIKYEMISYFIYFYVRLKNKMKTIEMNLWRN